MRSLHVSFSLSCTRPYSQSISSQSLDWGLIHEWSNKRIVLFGAHSMSRRLTSPHDSNTVTVGFHSIVLSLSNLRVGKS